MAGWTDGRVEVIIMLSQLLDVAVVEAEAELGNIHIDVYVGWHVVVTSIKAELNPILI